MTLSDSDVLTLIKCLSSENVNLLICKIQLLAEELETNMRFQVYHTSLVVTTLSSVYLGNCIASERSRHSKRWFKSIAERYSVCVVFVRTPKPVSGQCSHSISPEQMGQGIQEWTK